MSLVKKHLFSQANPEPCHGALSDWTTAACWGSFGSSVEWTRSSVAARTFIILQPGHPRIRLFKSKNPPPSQRETNSRSLFRFLK